MSAAGAPEGDSRRGDVPLRSALTEATTRRAVIALGNFDGVHLGHRALLRIAAARAADLGTGLLVVSFFPPAKVLFGDAQFLTSEAEKHALLAEAGASEVVVVPFTRAFAATPPETFARQLTDLGPQVAVVGEDFRFGRDRAGGLDLLRGATAHLEVVPLELVGGEVVKSSTIRAALADGDVARAEALLGAPYRVQGVVVTGDRRGRTIGFPTANLRTDPRKALPIGVFAVEVDTPAGRFGGMANVGPRPTFPDAAPTLEAHLFDVDVALEGRPITVHLRTHLRPPRRFDGVDALRQQLARDARDARAALAQAAAREHPLEPADGPATATDA